MNGNLLQKLGGLLYLKGKTSSLFFAFSCCSSINFTTSTILFPNYSINDVNNCVINMYFSRSWIHFVSIWIHSEKFHK